MIIIIKICNIFKTFKKWFMMINWLWCGLIFEFVIHYSYDSFIVNDSTLIYGISCDPDL